MTKYTEQFKLQVVNDYLAGSVGFKTVAGQHGLAAPVVRRWVEWYRRHGVDGLSKKARRYSAESKLSVLQHMWDNSLSQTQVAAHFNIGNLTSIGTWGRRYLGGGIEALARPPRTKHENLETPAPKPAPKPSDDERKQWMRGRAPAGDRAGQGKRSFALRRNTVFNAQQIDGIPDLKLSTEKLFDPVERGEGGSRPWA